MMSKVDVKMRREIGRQFSMASVGADVKSACGVGSGNFYTLEIAPQHTTLMINSLTPYSLETSFLLYVHPTHD